MIDMQTAVDVAKQGTSGLWFDAGMLTLVLTTVGLIARDWVRTRNRNGSTAPGNAESCKKHAERLTKVETKVEDFEQIFQDFRIENRDDHQRIFDKLDEK